MKTKIKNIFMIFVLLVSMFIIINPANASSSNDYGALSVKLLNQDPDPANPGEYVELRFKVTKSGNDVIENVKFELKPSFPFSFDNSDSPIKEIGNWYGNSDEEEYYTLYYKLRVAEDAIEGDYEIKLIQKINSKSDIEKEFTIRVDEKKNPKLNIGYVKTSPAKLIADYDEGLVEVEIVNNGESAAKQVVIQMNLPEEFTESFGYSSKVNLGTIDSGSSKTAKFYIDTKTGLKSGNYQTSLELNYKDDTASNGDRIKKLELPFDIKVFGRPEYKIENYVAKPTTEGKKSSISFNVKNIGSRSSDTTSVQIFKDSSQPFEFVDKSDFIGSLDVDETGQVKFDYKVKSDAVAKECKLKLQIRSVIDGDVIVEDETISVTVNEKKGLISSNMGTYFLYLIILIIGGLLGMKLEKSRFKKNKK